MRLSISLGYFLVVILNFGVSSGLNLNGLLGSHLWKVPTSNYSKSSNNSENTDITEHEVAVIVTEDMINNTVKSSEFHELIEHLSPDEILILTKIFKRAATRKATYQNNTNEEQTIDTDQLIKFLNTLPKLSGVNGTNRTDQENLNESLPTISTENLVFRPKDCAELLIAGAHQDGEYTIYPFRCHCSPPVQVFCDMTTDGGGWTVILSRKAQDPQEDFDRSWEEYAQGFGIPQGEYWMGNRHLHMLTSSERQILRIEATEPNVHGEWNNFTVTSEEDLFQILLSHPNPKNTVSDAFKDMNGFRFSTFDQDSDEDSKHNCASEFHGGWWYGRCSTTKSEERRRKVTQSYNRYDYEEDYTYSFDVLNEETFLPMTGIYTSGNSSGIATNPWSKYDNIVEYPSEVYLKIRPLLCSEKISKVYLNNPDILCQQ